MKRHRFTIAIALLCLLTGQAALSQTNIIPLRLMTYNIRHGAGMDDVIDLDRQAAIIANAAPDVVGLQEVDSCVKRSGYKPQAALLGKKTGMYATFGAAIPLTGGKYGVAILSKEHPLSIHHLPLPGTEKRTLLVCEFQEYVFACTHLDLDEECRLNSLNIIIEEAERWGDKPFFICGDWNDQPSSTLITKMKKNNTFVFLNGILNNSIYYTFPAKSPNKIIDYIASYGRVHKSLKKRTVLNEPEASDHRPVLVDITLESYTTGIERIDNGQQTTDKQRSTAEGEVNGQQTTDDDAVYDLSGRRVSAEANSSFLILHSSLKKGIYIQAGKKILVK